MAKQMLFTDASVNPKSNIGYGAYLLISEQELFSKSLSNQVKVKRFEHTSSTKLELQTLLWALNTIQPANNQLMVYTDCQNIIGLKQRRKYLEKNNYHSKKNKYINNYQLYQEFYTITDQLNCELVKVCGHSTQSKKNEIDKIFTLVDRASRNALREDNLFALL